MQKGDEESVKSLATIQENIESSAKEISHTTQKDRDSYKKRMPPTVTLGDAAAARCSNQTERKGLRNKSKKRGRNIWSGAVSRPGKTKPEECS